MTHGNHSLEDLADRTGFTPRQIRYYITRGLAPGAGTRGPNVRYGDETLRRLLLVARLKTLEIQPTGRAPTLEEIGKMIDSLGADDADRLLDGGMELAIVDTEADVEPEPSLQMGCTLREEEWTRTDHLIVQDTPFLESVLRSDPVRYGPDLGPLAEPLSQLRELLGEMLGAPTVPHAGESWRRIRTPDIEIHVRVPGDAARRERLEQAVMVLHRLLD